MTNWYECDRCQERSKNRKEFFVIQVSNKKITYTGKPRFARYDFCRTCEEEFNKWVKKE